jgi:hypothetical protein
VAKYVTYTTLVDLLKSMETRAYEDYFPDPECTISVLLQKDERKGNLLRVENVTGDYVELRNGDSLGFDRGKIWRLLAPEKYDDPIFSLLALTGVSKRVLRIYDGPVKVTANDRYFVMPSRRKGISIGSTIVDQGAILLYLDTPRSPYELVVRSYVDHLDVAFWILREVWVPRPNDRVGKGILEVKERCRDTVDSMSEFWKQAFSFVAR